MWRRFSARVNRSFAAVKVAFAGVLPGCAARAVFWAGMGRNLYILAATLALFAMVSCGLAYTNVAQQPGSPGDVSLWRTTGLGLLVLALVIALAGMLSALFEQAERRAEENRLREREQRRRRGDAPWDREPPTVPSSSSWRSRVRARTDPDRDEASRREQRGRGDRGR